jgi:predicted CoA-binding protein
MEIVTEVKRLGYSALWFQPGTSTPEAIAAAEAADLRVVAGPCLAKEYLRLLDGQPLIPKVSDT